MDIVFKCRKCESLYFLEEGIISFDFLKSFAETDCPKCGEEGYLNWVLYRTGDYEKEFGKK